MRGTAGNARARQASLARLASGTRPPERGTARRRLLRSTNPTLIRRRRKLALADGIDSYVRIQVPTRGHGGPEKSSCEWRQATAANWTRARHIYQHPSLECSSAKTAPLFCCRCSASRRSMLIAELEGEYNTSQRGDIHVTDRVLPVCPRSSGTVPVGT